ncbi:hypothetical protein PYW07_015032 [Mythimna separata]|uniref:Cytochrome P450 n=1 Tax=Mythimna separata TaxID=271217 RepID=A0AAD7Z034_MYTSE|nr:hypothetical protein PYW07_015032 [Mythimna separata]
MLWLLVGVLLVVWTAVSRWRNRKLIALGKTLSVKGICLPIVGQAYQLLGSHEEAMIKMDKVGKEAYERGGIVSMWQGDFFYIMVADPEIADFLLKTCLEKTDLMRLFRALLGNGNIFAPVSIWRPRRKVLAPIFSQKNLNSFVEVFSQQSRIMVNQLSKVAGKGTFSVWKTLTTYSMDSVCETTLGTQLNTQLEPELPFLRNFENCCRIDAKRIFEPWFYNNTVNKILNNKAFNSYARSKEYIWKYMDKIILSKWKSFKEEKQASDSNQGNEKSWKTFLELLIESPVNYDNVELREETLVLVLAGTDTSAVGAAFTLTMLSKYPDIQEKVFEELQEVFGNSDRPATHEDLPRLKYLDAVIRETLRLYPPVPFITRKVEKDVTLPSGVTLTDGCNLLVSIWAIHRNPKYWGDDAELFRPERFLDTALTHPAAYMPFSSGPRSCLGYQYAMMSMKTALSTLLRRYRVLPSESTNETPKAQNDLEDANNNTSKSKLRVEFSIMMKHVNNFEIQLETRT